MSKYNNKKCSCEFQGEIYKFDSKAELRYFLILTEKLKRSEIDKLKLQPRYELTLSFSVDTDKTKSGTSKIGSLVYTPDFEYIENGKKVAVEVKGMKTAAYQMRKKLFIAIAKDKYDVDTFIEVFQRETFTYNTNSIKIINAKKMIK